MRTHRLRSLFAVVGLAALAFGTAACSGSDLGGSKGNVRISLATGGSVAAATTSPSSGDTSHTPKALNVTFSGIEARNLDGQLVAVDMALPTTVDLLGLLDGRTLTLPVGLLPPATYDQFVVVMKKVEIVTQNDTTIAITPPGGGWTAIVPADPFVVEDGQTTSVTLTFRLDESLRYVFDHFEFDPHFDCHHD